MKRDSKGQVMVLVGIVIIFAFLFIFITILTNVEADNVAAVESTISMGQFYSLNAVNMFAVKNNRGLERRLMEEQDFEFYSNEVEDLDPKYESLLRKIFNEEIDVEKVVELTRGEYGEENNEAWKRIIENADPRRCLSLEEDNENYLNEEILDRENLRGVCRGTRKVREESSSSDGKPGPEAKFEASFDSESRNIQLDASRSTVDDVEIDSYSWSSPGENLGTGRSLSVDPDVSSIQLTVVDSEGKQDSVTKNIRVIYGEDDFYLETTVQGAETRSNDPFDWLGRYGEEGGTVTFSDLELYLLEQHFQDLDPFSQYLTGETTLEPNSVSGTEEDIDRDTFSEEQREFLEARESFRDADINSAVIKDLLERDFGGDYLMRVIALGYVGDGEIEEIINRNIEESDDFSEFKDSLREELSGLVRPEFLNEYIEILEKTGNEFYIEIEQNAIDEQDSQIRDAEDDESYSFRNDGNILFKTPRTLTRPTNFESSVYLSSRKGPRKLTVGQNDRQHLAVEARTENE